jgi:predicted MFS family arabinose efflux permease
MVKQIGWRESWQYLALTVFGMDVVFVLLARNPRPRPTASSHAGSFDGVTLTQALSSGTFWTFGLASSLFLWVSSGVGLFNEDVLAEGGFNRDHFITGLGISTLTTLVTNGLAGWLSTRWPLSRLMSAGMLLLAVCLLFLPVMSQPWHVYINAIFLGGSAGVVMVVYFACWGAYFGSRNLGKIQGCAQVLTVLASALGPVSLSLCRTQLGSYRTLFYLLAILALISAAGLYFMKSRPLAGAVQPAHETA